MRNALPEVRKWLEVPERAAAPLQSPLLTTSPAPLPAD
jgi:hypothetical protein